MRRASRVLFLAVVAAGPAHAQETALASLAGKYCGFVPGFDERSSYVHYTVPMDLTLSPDGAYSASLGREGALPKTINGKSSLAADTLRLKPGLVKSVGPKDAAAVSEVELRVVRWGTRVYLVPLESLSVFCKTKAESLDNCSIWSFVRADDLKKPRGTGPPC